MITGANGFVGSALLSVLMDVDNVEPVAGLSLARGDEYQNVSLEKRLYPDLGSPKFSFPDISDIDVIVHLAGISDVGAVRNKSDARRLLQVNSFSTKQIYKQAIKDGVRKFIYLSSAKVMGNYSPNGAKLDEEDTPSPQDWYAKSKLKAEQKLRNLSRTGNTKLIILRPPPIYGRNMRGNLGKLNSAIKKNLPLPLLKISSERSYIGLQNLTDILKTVIICQSDFEDAEDTYFVSDNADISISDLAVTLKELNNSKTLLFSLQNRFLSNFENMNNLPNKLQTIFCPLKLNITKVQKSYGWVPPYSMISQLNAIRSDD